MKILPMNNRSLKYWYGVFNKKFFDSKLPNILVRFRKVKATNFGETDIERKTYIPVEIRISPELKRQHRHAIITLLHEMCHVSNAIEHKRRCYHGPKFVEEMERIFKRGAYTRFNGGLL